MVNFNPKERTIIKTIRFADTETVKAGTPIDKCGNPVNDGTAVGILVYDVTFAGSHTGILMASGFIDLAAAEESCGLTISDEVKAALPDVYFDTGRTGISGSGLPEVTGSGKVPVSVNGEWVMQDGYGYSGVEAVTLINETVTLYEAGGVATGTFSKAFELVAGDSYNVTIDGVEHKGLVAQDLGGTFVRIMDGEVGSATFAVMRTKATLSPECTLTLVDPSDIGNHAVKVEHVAEVTRKIDSKYLPEVGGGDFIIEGIAREVESPVPMVLVEQLSQTFSAAKTAFLSGKAVKVKVSLSEPDVYERVSFVNATVYTSSDGSEALLLDGSPAGLGEGTFPAGASSLAITLPEE